MVNHDDVIPDSNSNDKSMVVIHDDDNSFVFPPVNHENLQILSDSSTPSSFSSSSSSLSSDCSFSAFDSDTWILSSPPSSFDSQIRKSGDFMRWMEMGVQILRSKLFPIISPFRNRATNRGAIWSIGVPVAVLVMSCWIIISMRKKKKRTLTPNEVHLINIIKEKDGKIAQLLNQIAQMNEILIDRHKALAAKSSGKIG